MGATACFGGAGGSIFNPPGACLMSKFWTGQPCSWMLNRIDGNFCCKRVATAELLANNFNWPSDSEKPPTLTRSIALSSPFLLRLRATTRCNWRLFSAFCSSPFSGVFSSMQSKAGRAFADTRLGAKL